MKKLKNKIVENHKWRNWICWKPQMKKLKILKITNEETETTNKDIEIHKWRYWKPQKTKLKNQQWKNGNKWNYWKPWNNDIEKTQMKNN